MKRTAEENPSAEIILRRRQIFMLPTRYGLLFAAVLVIMLVAAVNYSNGLAYALTFLLASISFVSLLYTHRNLYKLRVTTGPCAPVFAGQIAAFPVVLSSEDPLARWGIQLEHADADPARADVLAPDSSTVLLRVRTRKRGLLPQPGFRISTCFPLGFVYAWTRRLHLQQTCLVYPAPASASSTQARTGSADENALVGGHEGGDFVGLREFRPGDAPQHIAWKAVARGLGWHTKQFAGGGTAALWFDWDALPGIDTETRLGILCRWVVDAHQAGVWYGLRIPGTTVAPSTGAAHQRQCLERLALFPAA